MREIRGERERVDVVGAESGRERAAEVAVRATPLPVMRKADPSASGMDDASRARVMAAPAAPNFADAHAVAARGVASGGAALPHLDVIQRSFGPAHDVSRISAHVGAEATAASQAMGARGYATGSSVAFAGSPDLFTAAHEAAHVVQQAHGVHLSGGIGQEGDAHERHADAVATEVVAGRSAAPLLAGLSPFQGGRGGAQVQHRNQSKQTINAPGMTIEANGSMPHDEFRDAADAGEKEEKQSLAQQEQKKSTTPIVLQIGNGGERANAQRLIDDINGYREHLITGIHDGLIEPSALTANTSAALALGDFLVSAGEQGRTLTDFQRAYRTVKADIARFKSQLTLVQKQNPGLQGNLIDAWGGEKQLRNDTASISAQGSGQGGVHWAAMQREHEELEQQVGLAAAAQNHASASRFRVSQALNTIEGGVPTTEKNSVEGSEVLKTTAAIKKVIGFGIDKAFEHFELPGSKIASGAAEMIVDEFFRGELNVLDAKTAESSDKQKHGLQRAQVDALRAALAEWMGDMIQCYVAQKRITTLKNDMRDSARQFATAADDKEHFEVGMIAEMYAEADTLLQQITLAIGLGQAEQASSSASKEDRLKVVGDKQGLPFYEPDKTYTIRMRSMVDPRSVGWSYDAIERHIYFSAAGVGGTEGDGGVNPVMDAALKDLASARTTVQSSRDSLASALGFSKESPADVTADAAAGPK